MKLDDVTKRRTYCAASSIDHRTCILNRVRSSLCVIVCFPSVSVELSGGKARLVDSLCFLSREERCLNHTVSRKNLYGAYTADLVRPGVSSEVRALSNEARAVGVLW